MAYTPKEDEENTSGMNVLGAQNQSQLNQEQQNLQQSSGPAPSTSNMQPNSMPKAGTTNNQVTSGQSQAASAGGKGSGTFTNLQAYQKANQPAVQDISNQVQKSQTQAANQIGQQIQQQQSAFQRQVDENRQRMQQAENFAQQQIQQAGQQPMEDSAVARFQELLNQPNQFNQAGADYSALENRISNMQNLAKQGDRQDARLELLRQTFGGNDRYTSGQRALDDFLIAGSPEARRIASEAPKRAVENLQNQLQQAKLADQQEREMLGQETGSFQSKIQSDVDAAQQALLDRLENQKTEIEDRLGIGPGFLEAAQSGVVPQEYLDSLGLEDNRLYGVNVADYLTAAPTIEGLATQEDLDRANALARLEGTTQDIFLDPTQIGTYAQEEANQLQSLQDAVATQKAAYDEEIGSVNEVLEILQDPNRMATLAAQGRVDDLMTSPRPNVQEIDRNNLQNRMSELYRNLSAEGVSEAAMDTLLPTLAYYDPSNLGYISGTEGSYVDPRYSTGLANADKYGSADYNRAMRRRQLVQDLGQYNSTQDFINNVIKRYEQQQADIRNKYDYGNVLTAAKDGVVKKARKDAIKKLLNG